VADEDTITESNDDGAADAAAAGPEAELEQLREQVAALEDRALRVQAEAQNMIRRAERDVENARKFALERFAGALLPVIDNLERSLAALGTPTDATRPVAEGIELTYRSFLDVLKKFEIVAVDPAGQAFNPELHQAMAMVEQPDVAPNTVIQVMQKGYTLNGRLVRPAMVMVARPPAKIDETV
jgi:molecular chaperone GrpE